jgi:hypothetical protein
LTAQGHPRAIFSRAIEKGNLVIAEATAREMTNLTLEEALRPTTPRAQAKSRYRCNTQAMSTTQNRNRLGRFPKGVSGNPGGRPQGLAKATRELVGEDGMALAQLWWDIARDETRRDRDRLEASRLLADRGWGKAPTFEPLEGDPLDLAALEGAAEEFRAKILRLAEQQE